MKKDKDDAVDHQQLTMVIHNKWWILHSNIPFLTICAQVAHSVQQNSSTHNKTQYNTELVHVRKMCKTILGCAKQS